MVETLGRRSLRCMIAGAAVVSLAACDGGGGTDGPIVETATSAPSQSEPTAPPSEPVPSESEAPSGAPSSEAPSSVPVSEGMPAAVLPSVDPSLDAWRGFPPPAVFEALFPGGEFTGWPEQVGEYVLAEDKGNAGMVYDAVYALRGEPGEVFEVTLEPGAMIYGAQVDRWEEPVATLGFAVCQGEQPEWADCMVVANDSMIDVAWTGSKGAVSLEDTAAFLGDLVAAFHQQA